MPGMALMVPSMFATQDAHDMPETEYVALATAAASVVLPLAGLPFLRVCLLLPCGALAAALAECGFRLEGLDVDAGAVVACDTEAWYPASCSAPTKSSTGAAPSTVAEVVL